MKKKGSAVVLAVLLLSFFTAIALAVFYLGGKKGERAYLKVEGEEVSSEIDMGSTLAYYDAYMSEQFVRKGKVYSDDHPEYTSSQVYQADLTEATTSYITGGTTPPTAKYFNGITLKTYMDYFAGYWDSGAGYAGSGDYIPYIRNDYVNLNTTPARLAYREWTYDKEKMKRLWLYDGDSDDSSEEAITIGGYRLEKLEVVQDDDSTWDSGDEDSLVEIYPADGTKEIEESLEDATATGRAADDPTDATDDAAWLVRATYVKRIGLQGSSEVGEANFKLNAVHDAVIRFADTDGDGSLEIEELTVDDGELIEEIVIEKM